MKKNNQNSELKFNRIIYAILAVLLLIGGTAIFVYHAQQNDPESSEYADSSDDSSTDSTDDDDIDDSSDDESESSTETSSTSDSNVDQVVSMIQSQFKDKATVSYDKDSKAILIIPSDSEFTDEVVDVANGDGDEDTWNDLTDSINDVSSQMVSKYGAKVGLAIVNPQNHDKVLYEALDGNTIYDVVTDGSDK
ncbi:hypothetical protein LRLP16767_LR202_01220 [Limosilactobacillus reuteri]|uniref:Uncharacterized protein n=1 Tax=Limosilactobacillus reuteri TaxID=1598 RepID=A0A0U5JU65_LIMRT|nr:hypothetical protein [Limosilactobacillus reuteri]MCC4435805.1 hypothetical protein [Limosilactobacillus reuteri]MCC4438125.1 hypothetical protein [Limosilactobacillus reuteri]MCC4442685.1 hypothetical protein [Limosilactobacillus reuteri]MCC4444193.1 hypothetical protein [Limosilactobacillus reuteri]MCC4445879.1 hypothetical protein [Limosilactobacillus reuteri]